MHLKKTLALLKRYYAVTPIYSQWGILGYIKYWSHPKKKNGVEVDSAKAHKNVIFGSVKNETKSIIKSATDNYTYLKSSKALW
ncbi:MAG: hypothetical protein IJE74_03340 [Clostridia bacterium]|nr:hypothetical protein [Clostridia bacterium]